MRGSQTAGESPTKGGPIVAWIVLVDLMYPALALVVVLMTSPRTLTRGAGSVQI